MKATILKKWRKSKKISQWKFGAMLKPPVHPTTVDKWERDSFPAERLAEICKVTGLKSWQLRPDIVQPPEKAEE